jgi:hypothetical protein
MLRRRFSTAVSRRCGMLFRMRAKTCVYQRSVTDYVIKKQGKVINRIHAGILACRMIPLTPAVLVSFSGFNIQVKWTD